MARDFYQFADRAIGLAGKIGAEKRKARLSEFREAEAGKAKRIGMQEAGSTRRQSMLEAGSTKRKAMEETGLETRHLREYAAPGKDSPGGFRYAELESKRLSAADKLTAASSKERYEADIDALFYPHLSATETDYQGNPMLPLWAEQIKVQSKAISTRDPEAAVRFAQQQVQNFQDKKAFEELPIEEKARILGIKLPETEDQAGAKAKKRASTAARLRTEYEEEQRKPYIFEETGKKLAGAWRTRKPSPGLGSYGSVFGR